MTDLYDRITFEPAGVTAPSIAWPASLVPQVQSMVRKTTDESLPQADVLVVTWTSAEWMALADVFTPSVHKAKWWIYTKNYAVDFEPHLTDRSPARDAGCLGEFEVVKIGEKTVVLFHSQLHLATDDNTAPVVDLWKQIIAEVSPSLIITTGTAGGIGASTQLGDVFIVNNAKFNCTKEFATLPWAQKRYSSGNDIPTLAYGTEPLMRTTVGDHLESSNIMKRPIELVTGGDVETVDYFAFADTDDSFGVVKNDPHAHTEEMDDATLPLALDEMYYADTFAEPAWLSIRNASDPQVPSSLGDVEIQKKWASSIYEKYGYWTTVASAVACWGVIVGMA